MTTSPTQKRGRKYGSDYARAWSRGLHFRTYREGKEIGDVRTKTTLNAICNYVDEDGSCWPSIGTLADDTDQSNDSIRRRLVLLESYGVIARFPRWRDENGKINYEDRGKRTTDEIRLLFNVTQEEIDVALASRSSKSADDPDDSAAIESDSDPSQQQGLDVVSPSIQQGSNPSQQQGTPSHCSDLHDDPSLYPILPQSPFLEKTEGQSSTQGSQEWIERFLRKYPKPTNRPDQVENLVKALTEAERADAMKAASGISEYCSKGKTIAQNKFVPLSPEKFLARKGGWSQWFEYAPKPPPEVFLATGSDGHRAAAVMAAIMEFQQPHPRTWVGFEGEGLLRYTEFPEPGGRALVEYAGADASVDKTGWLIAEEGSPEFKAWSDRIRKWSGQKIEAYRIGLGIMKKFEWPKGVFTDVEQRAVGYRVPRKWPPRVDGTWPEESDLAQTG